MSSTPCYLLTRCGGFTGFASAADPWVRGIDGSMYSTLEAWKLQDLRPAGWLAGWLDGWLAGWLAALLAGWLVGWLAATHDSEYWANW